ncbi:50S ribosomal protein L10 [Candidatus Gracilibacteria bacterium]|nr:50S ribosomal protein L10 [Candidatus Gracilibacteria bacterium]
MALTKDQKKDVVAKLVEQMRDCKAAVFADYQGLSVEDMKDLRSKMREKGVKFTVSKKTLIKHAAKELGFEEIPDESLQGPVGVAFGMEDEISAAKIMYEFSKTNENLKLRGAIFEGKLLSISETKELAMLPGKDELIAKFIYLIKSPITGFHGVLKNTISGFVRALDAIKEKQSV